MAGFTSATISPGQALAQAGPDTRVLERFDTLEQAKGNEAMALAVTQGPSVVPIYRPGMPIRMVSALDPTALKEGEFALLQNVRPDTDVISARYPTTLFQGGARSPQTTTFSPSLAGGSLPRGVWSGILNGSTYVVTAWTVPQTALSTTLASACAQNATSLSVASATGIAANGVLQIDTGTSLEYVTVASSYTSGTTIPLSTPTQFAHASGAAVAAPTLVALYSSTNGYAFEEVTAASGAYGNTRLTDSGANVAFQAVSNVSPTGVSTDYLIAQNGIAYPTVYSTTAVNSAYCVGIKPVAAPTTYETTTPTLSCGGYLSMSNLGSPNNTTTPGGVTTQSQFYFSVASPVAIAFQLETSLSAGYSAAITTSSSAYSFTGTTQLCLAVSLNSGFDSILVTLRLDVYDYLSSSWITVYDPNPSAPVGSPPTEVAFGSNIGLFPGAVFAYNNESMAGLQIGGIRYVAPATISNPIAPIAGIIVAVYAGGSISTPAGSGLAVSYFNSGSKTESAGVILPVPSVTPTLTSVGMVGLANQSLPLSPSLYYNLSAPALASAQYGMGVDTLNIYVAFPGSTTYGYAQSVNLATYASGWSNSASVGTLVTATAIPVETYTSPDAYIVSAPAGTCMAGGGGRLLVGSGSQYWFSEYPFPFRFRLALDVSNGVARSSSGGYCTLPNAEKCAGFAVSGASALGTSSFYLFTNASTYNITGPDGVSLSSPTLLASVGCSAPDSIAVYRDSIFFLDDNYQIIKFSYGQSQFYFYQNVNSYQLMLPLSKRVVDDQTRAIPASRLAFAQGCAVYDRYYFAYTPGGGTANTLMLVFDMTTGCFVQDTPTVGGMSAEAMCPCTIGGRSVYCQSIDRQCYEWENTASAVPVSASVVSGAMNPNGGDRTFFGRIKLVADVQSGQTATLTKYLIAGGDTPYGSASTDVTYVDMATGVSGGQVYRYDWRVSGGANVPGGNQGLSCQIGLALAMTPGSRIFAIENEQMASSPGADSL